MSRIFSRFALRSFQKQAVPGDFTIVAAVDNHLRVGDLHRQHFSGMCLLPGDGVAIPLARHKTFCIHDAVNDFVDFVR